jgi:hypothetical protein
MEAALVTPTHRSAHHRRTARRTTRLRIAAWNVRKARQTSNGHGMRAGGAARCVAVQSDERRKSGKRRGAEPMGIDGIGQDDSPRAGASGDRLAVRQIDDGERRRQCDCRARQEGSVRWAYMPSGVPFRRRRRKIVKDRAEGVRSCPNVIGHGRCRGCARERGRCRRDDFDQRNHRQRMLCGQPKERRRQDDDKEVLKQDCYTVSRAHGCLRTLPAEPERDEIVTDIL